MAATTHELASARELIQDLLDELGLDAYIFEVEPRGQAWELRLECANDNNGSWTTISMQLSPEQLYAAFDSVPARESLRDMIQHEVNTCKHGQSPVD